MREELRAVVFKESYDDIFELFSDATKATLFALFGFSVSVLTGGIGLALFNTLS